ncbi:hypothetical protein MPSEU_001090600 [Mayamaea pseudoterrestris]|nr:hypothetical protein MPSEU_001090600 [Mayamaea pseudoterrestris]
MRKCTWTQCLFAVTLATTRMENVSSFQSRCTTKHYSSRSRGFHLAASSSRRPQHPSSENNSFSKRPATAVNSLSNSQKRRLRKVSEGRTNQRKQEQALKAMDLPEQPLMQTLPGGTEMIFKMARSLMLWQQDGPTTPDDATIALPTPSTPALGNANFWTTAAAKWRPTPGISDRNPDFRTQSPVMNSQGYASLIWRNVRKRNKPSLWKYALRTYDRMQHDDVFRKRSMSDLTNQTMTMSNSATPTLSKIPPKNIHHEGALLACAKLCLWEPALAIFTTVERHETKCGGSRRLNKRATAIHVTDSMVLSLIRAAVRAARQGREHDDLNGPRAPLDQVKSILLSLQSTHPHLQLAARHWNPLAAAYQSLGLATEASALLNRHLADRSTGPESSPGEPRTFNVYDVLAKDKACYSLLVHGAVSTNDWVAAVNALRNMTEAGLHPTTRHLNSWTEVSERSTNTRTTRSWKKKRDEAWLTG